jgi:cephalosporin-C deacetylase-like acetyl esterase
MLTLDRRGFLMTTGALAAGLNAPSAQSPIQGSSSYAQELPDMMFSYLAKKLNSLSARWDEKRALLRSAEDVEARNRFVRSKFIEMIGGLPERTPLHAATVAIHEREGYCIESVLFQSQPNFWVTGNLYIPTSHGGPFPGVISPCGHYPLARMQPTYQVVYLNLVRNGFVVLAYDPIGQGERRPYWNPLTNTAEMGEDPDLEHAMAGQLFLLVGETITQYFIWDGMRAIDYLETRPEVDKQKIGCAGHSGGGTETLFISALDERVKCAVVCEGGTDHAWPVRIQPGTPVEPQNTEDNLCPAAVFGIDFCDLHVAIAPRPLLALIENYSPEFNLTAQHILDRYRQLGVPERFATGEATDPHAWTYKLRLLTTDWLCRWFYNRPGPTSEPEFATESPSTLYCTPNGSLRYSQVGETIFSLLWKKQAKLPPERKPPRNATELVEYQRETQSKIVKLLHYRETTNPLGVHHLVTTPRKGYHVEKLEFLSEPGIYIPSWVFVPDGANKALPTILYVDEAGKQEEGMEFGGGEADGLEPGLLQKLVRKGNLVVSVDVRGIGDTVPPHTPLIHTSAPAEFRQLFDVETTMTYMAWTMDESVFGMRVQDVVRSVDYTLSRPDVDKQTLRVVGKGMGALWALYAAVLDSRIRSVVCEGSLLSYRMLTGADRYLYGANVFVPHILTEMDLPQVAAAVADRHLVLLSPVDHMKELVEVERARSAYQWTRETYVNVGATDHFRIIGPTSRVSVEDQYLA